MLFYNLKTIKSQSIDQYQTISIQLSIPNILKLSYIDYISIINSQIAAKIKQLKIDNNTPILFSINLQTNDKLDFNDVDQFYICSISALCNQITFNTSREREKRLTVDTTNININYSTLLKLVNYKTLVDIFNVEFKYNNITINMID